MANLQQEVCIFLFSLKILAKNLSKPFFHNKDTQQLVDASFEYVCGFDDAKLFRKRKVARFTNGADGIHGGAAGI